MPCFVAALQTRWNSAVQKQILLTSSKHCILAPRAQQLAASGMRELEGWEGMSSLLFSPVPVTSSRSSSAVGVRRAQTARFGLPQGWTHSPHPPNADAEPNSWTLGFCVQVSAMKWVSSFIDSDKIFLFSVQIPASVSFWSVLHRIRRLSGSVCRSNCSPTEDIQSHSDLMKKSTYYNKSLLTESFISWQLN